MLVRVTFIVAGIIAGWAFPAAACAQTTPDQILGISEPDPGGGWVGRAVSWTKAGFDRASRGGSMLGFWDVGASIPSGGSAASQIGDLEFDFAKSIGKNVEAAGAVVYNRESGTRLSVGFLDYHFFGGMISSRGRIFAEKGFHIQAGRFDIPLGGDWKYFASKDRVTVAPPLTTELVMDGGYNDYGLRVVATHASFNYTGYVLRGFGGGKAVGGRIGLTPFSTPYAMGGSRDPLLEIGFSFLYDTDRLGLPENRIAALDLGAGLGRFNVQMEYVARDSFSDVDRSRIQRGGFSLSVAEDLMRIGKFPLKVHGRYERFTRIAEASIGTADGSDPICPSESLTRLGAGVHLTFSDLVILKSEYQRFPWAGDEALSNEGVPRSALLLQLVFLF